MTASALLWLRPGARRVPGGHLTQIDQTAHHLRLLGVHAVVTDEPDPDLSHVDVVHAFGLPLELVRRARMRGIPTCVSTIYISRQYYGPSRPLPADWHDVHSRFRVSASLLRHGVRGRHVDAAWHISASHVALALLFESADLILPNSDSEARAIHEQLGVSTPHYVVPNGVNDDIFRLPHTEAKRSTVVCAGRFEPHKNQLGLIRALRGSPYHLTIVGPPHPDHPRYAATCERWSGPNVTVDVRMYAPEELAALYGAAKVNVLATMFETTGLTNLEAALCGAEVVSTDRGFARDYFGDLGWYCNPEKPASIRAAVDAAFAAPHDDRLRQRVLHQYTWHQTARATLSAYDQILR